MCIGVLAVAEALAAPGPRRPSLSENDLLSGAALPTLPAAGVPLGPADAFGLDDEMRAFVMTGVGTARERGARLQRLLDAMKDRGLFSLDYSNTVTSTARETFHERQGNCLSFTMLFVALARESGLEVSYQIVNVPPTWTAEADLVVITTHINAIVKTTFGDSYVVDFNVVDPQKNSASKRIADDYALALFYTNLGAEALIRKEYDLSFRYLREAVRTHPGIAGPWINLGLLYARQGLPQYAEAAYLHALASNADDRSALTNLAALYAAIGERQLADEYMQRIRRYQQHNPYYHYVMAQDAFRAQRFDEALDALRRAIRLKRDDHQFYSLQAQAYLGLGRKPEAAASFVHARDYAASGELKARYDAELGALRGEPPRTR